MRLQALRKNQKLAQMDLARELGTTQQTISNWENDSILPSVEMLIKIADYFHVSTDYLLERDDRRYLEVTGLSSEVITHLQLLIEDING